MTGFHGQVLGHLVRRGVQATTNHLEQQQYQDQVEDQVEAWENSGLAEPPTWGLYLIGGTIVLAVLMLCSVRYTLRGVISTLAMVENPQTTYLVKEMVDEKVDPNTVLTEESIDSEVIVLKQKPITARIRTAISHLQKRAGFRARWRGLSLFVFYNVVFHWFNSSFAQLFIATFMGEPQENSIEFLYAPALASVLSSVLLARYAMAWTHVVISEPSEKTWFRRLPGLKAWKKVVVPTAINAIAIQMCMFLPAVFFFALRLNDHEYMQSQEACSIATKLLAVFGIGLVTYIGLVIPSEVALVRVQASMLPEEHESIVPFDRTFGGKVVPEILGGTGAIGWLDAWKTFDGAARLRLLKLFAQIAIVELFLHAFWALIIGAEVLTILGPALNPLISSMHAQLTGNGL